MLPLPVKPGIPEHWKVSSLGGAQSTVCTGISALLFKEFRRVCLNKAKRHCVHDLRYRSRQCACLNLFCSHDLQAGGVASVSGYVRVRAAALGA